VLAVVILVRGSAGYLLGALIVAFFATLRVRRHDPAGLRNLLRKGAFIAFLSGVLGASFYLWVPQAYKDSGQITGVFWHRMVISLGANPAWPFGDLRDVYAPCKPYHPSLYATPQSLVPGFADWNGQCIWVTYALEHGLTLAEMMGGIYSGPYETVMKEAFFEIARNYPTQVFETFIYYKPILILTTARDLIRFGAPGKTLGIKSLLLALALAQASALAGFVVFGASGEPENRLRLLAGALLLFSIFNMVPYFVAWCTPISAAEVAFYIVSDLAVALIAVFEAIRRPPKVDASGRASG